MINNDRGLLYIELYKVYKMFYLKKRVGINRMRSYLINIQANITAITLQIYSPKSSMKVLSSQSTLRFGTLTTIVKRLPGGRGFPSTNSSVSTYKVWTSTLNHHLAPRAAPKRRTLGGAVSIFCNHSEGMKISVTRDLSFGWLFRGGLATDGFPADFTCDAESVLVVGSTHINSNRPLLIS